MDICVLASGSKGNATVIRDKGVSLLIDDGLNMNCLAERMHTRDMDVKDIKAILVTHEHIDHIRGVAVLSKRLNIPVYANERIIEDIISRNKGGDINIIPFNESGMNVAGFDVSSFRVPHDAAYTVGYTVGKDGVKAGIATDLGTMTDNILTRLSECNTVILESNHDIDMLMNGSYPFALKMRIRSVNGHMSNEDAAKSLIRLYGAGVRNFVLAHLSEDNNTPEIAFDTSKNIFDAERLKEGKDYSIDVAMQWNAGKIITLR